MTPIRTATALIATAIVAGCAGLWFGGHPESLPASLRDAFVQDDAAIQAEVIDSVRDNFFREVDADELRQASLKGIVEALDDRFSHYFTPEETKLFRESIQGSFSGVGMTVDENDRGLEVVSVFDDSPAKKAGIKPGDLIIAVEGKPIAGVALDIATARIKGEPGTRVRLTLARPKTKGERVLNIKRERIVVPIVAGKLHTVGRKKLGAVRLASFTAGSHGQLRKEVQRLLDAGAKGIVLDLRGNGGGLLQEAVLVTSIFVENGLVVSTDGRAKPRREFTAEGKALPQMPLVVLVDRGSASASEIVTGALRDRKRATLVGTRTFGKGVFQEVADLSNGGALDITVGSYFLPSGENISKKGITPSVRAKDDPDTRSDEALRRALEELVEKVG